MALAELISGVSHALFWKHSVQTLVGKDLEILLGSRVFLKEYGKYEWILELGKSQLGLQTIQTRTKPEWPVFEDLLKLSLRDLYEHLQRDEEGRLPKDALMKTLEWRTGKGETTVGRILSWYRMMKQGTSAFAELCLYLFARVESSVSTLPYGDRFLPEFRQTFASEIRFAVFVHLLSACDPKFNEWQHVRVLRAAGLRVKL
jgi:hypothetical protein